MTGRGAAPRRTAVGRRRLRRVGGLVAVALLLAGCSGGGTPFAASGDQKGFVAGNGAAVVVPVTERRAAPDLSGRTLDGGTLSLASLRGHVVVLNVWGSWCAPCREEAPTLEGASRDYRDRDVRFVGINTRDQDAAAKAFVRRFGLTYPSLVDEGGTLLLGFRDTLPPNAIPSTIVVDPQGRVAARVLGPVEYTTLARLLDGVLSGSSPSGGAG